MIGLVATAILLGAAPPIDPGARTSFAAVGSSTHAGADPGPPGPLRFLMRVAREDARAYACRRTALVLLGGGALSAACLAVEDADATARRLSGRTWKSVADVGNAYSEPAVLGVGALVLLGAGEVSGNANLRGAGFEAGRSLVYSYLMVAGLKVAVDRTRPDGGRYSFPSGHAAGASAVAPVLARHFGRRAAIPAYAMVVVTAVGRLEARKHYLSDVVFGAAIGSSVGLAVGRPDSAGSRVGVSMGPDGVRVTARF